MLILSSKPPSLMQKAYMVLFFVAFPGAGFSMLVPWGGDTRELRETLKRPPIIAKPPKLPAKEKGMAARLGNVIYWLGLGIAMFFGAVTALHIGYAIWAPDDRPGNVLTMAAMFGLIAGASYMSGRAAKYILSGD